MLGIVEEWWYCHTQVRPCLYSAPILPPMHTRLLGTVDTVS